MSTNARSLSYIIVYSVHFICALSIQISKVCQDIYMLPSYCWQNTAKVPLFNVKEFQNIVFQQNSSLQQLPCSSPFWRCDQSISSISFRGALDPPFLVPVSSLWFAARTSWPKWRVLCLEAWKLGRVREVHRFSLPISNRKLRVPEAFLIHEPLEKHW